MGSASRATTPWRRPACCLPIFPPASARNCRATRLCQRFAWAAWPSISHSRGRVWALHCWADAFDRAARPEIAAHALMVDAKDEAAQAFYRHHGFIALPEAPRTLFLPLATRQPGAL